MTLSSAYIELFIRGKSPGEKPGGKCPDTSQKTQREIANYWSTYKYFQIASLIELLIHSF